MWHTVGHLLCRCPGLSTCDLTLNIKVSSVILGEGIKRVPQRGGILPLSVLSTSGGWAVGCWPRAVWSRALLCSLHLLFIQKKKVWIVHTCRGLREKKKQQHLISETFRMLWWRGDTFGILWSEWRMKLFYMRSESLNLIVARIDVGIASDH